MKQFKHFKGIYEHKEKIYTRSLAPGKKVYEEELYFDKQDELEYRGWDPERSKLGAALKKGISQIGIKEGDYILYLGSSTGTTASHVSDIVGENGMVFALDFAPRVLRDLVFVAESRPNIAPILSDANHPETYDSLISEVDAIFMDIAQKNQIDIFLKNFRFLKKGGFGLLALKARSVDVTGNPKDILKHARVELEKKTTLVDHRDLEPFEMDHGFFVCKKS